MILSKMGGSADLMRKCSLSLKVSEEIEVIVSVIASCWDTFDVASLMSGKKVETVGNDIFLLVGSYVAPKADKRLACASFSV